MDTVESGNTHFHSFSEHLMRTCCVILSYFFRWSCFEQLLPSRSLQCGRDDGYVDITQA